MRKILAIAFLAIASAALAHPASGIELEFDAGDHLLTVTIEHSVKDPAKHHIDEVAVSLNGDEIITQKCKTQTDGDYLVVQYIIPDAKVGDEIEVMANCNKFGKEKEELTVKPAEDETEE